MKLIIILILVAILGFLLWRSYQNRSFNESSDHIEIVLNGFKVNWFFLIVLGISSFLIYAKDGLVELNFGEYFLTLLFFWLVLAELGNFIFQLTIKNDRLILKKEEIFYLADQKLNLATNSIKELSLNGFTNQLIIKGNKSIAVSINRFSEENLAKLIQYLEKEIGTNKLKISDNLKKIIKH